MSNPRVMPFSKWSRYKQLSIRIGTGEEAEAYLKRIEEAMKRDRRRTRADWLKFVIDLALERGEIPPPPSNGRGTPAGHLRDTSKPKRKKPKKR